MPISWNEVNENANGGTENMARRLDKEFTTEELEHVQIIPSRPRELDPDRHRIFWCHDLPQDPESKTAFENNGWSRFEKIIFVSHWQKDQYITAYNIPYEKCMVLQNAIDPLPDKIEKNFQKIRLIYHTTPHRGLDVAYYAIDRLTKDHPDIEFNVYSSFKIYGWDQRDNEFSDLYKAIADHPNMNYHGTVSNKDVRKAVEQAHIFAYPSTWPETSCISLMEAMSGKCLCVHSDLAALPETSANWTYMYPFNEDKRAHVEVFASCLHQGIVELTKGSQSIESRLLSQKSYADLFYNWELRKVHWAQVLESLKSLDVRPIIETEEFEVGEFVYNV